MFLLDSSRFFCKSEKSDIFKTIIDYGKQPPQRVFALLVGLESVDLRNTGSNISKAGYYKHPPSQIRPLAADLKLMPWRQHAG